MASNVAYFQDAEDDAISALEGAERTYARSVAPGSPIKQKANSARTRGKDMMRRSSAQDPGLTDSDDTVNDPTTAKYERQRRERDKERDRPEERRRRKKDDHKAADRREQERPTPKKSAVRPPVKHVKTAPVVHTQQPDEYRRPRFEDDSSQYGIQPAQAPRPRGMSNRPNSYYGQGTRPPPANERWYAQNAPSPYAPSPMAPSPMQPMPQQSPFTPGMPYAHPQEWAQPGGMPYPAPPSSANDYFPPPHHAPPPQHAGPPQPAPAPQGQAHLAQRFQRPSSAMGHRSISTGSYEHDPYEKENMPRRRSVKIRPAEDDPRQLRDDPRQLMPPPPRPKTSQPSRQAVKGPPRQKPAPKMPPPRQIAPASYDSDTFDDDESLIYQQVVQYEYDDGVVERPRAHRRGSSAYSREGYHIEPAAGRARRHSYMAAADSYPEPKVGSYSEHKMAEAQHAAMAYQNGVSGGPSAPLTAAALKAKQSKSSRSSGSSESRDDSEYRQSATTRTTRSSAIESEDVTIKVTGSAVLKIGGAEIQCQDGGEINITQPSRNGGSDRASTVYSDDRPTRRDSRPLPIRARADSWNRSQVSDYSYVPQGRPPFF
ncbi:hypothetical protein CcaCcLH18_01911 [Colletotrichum camelliae]|nr:hypothetical protein CcaCcLH18_01911 [Colletotrichum camelliae]